MARSSHRRWKTRSTLFALLSLFAVLAESQQTQRSFLDNFVGTVEVVDSSEMRSSRIRFPAGARTNWHVHSERQLLLIEKGRGRVQELGGPIRVLAEGESFYTQANVPHWHGADPDHEAMQFSVYAGTLEWQQPVTDEEYRGR
jgi:quercetin dioxygenase-like cupin family protein